MTKSNTMWGNTMHTSTALGFKIKIRFIIDIHKINKKSKLMLIRRARAYGSSCLQVILVYLHLFCRNSLFCNWKLPKKHKKLVLRFKIIWGHRCWYLIPLKSTSSVLVRQATCCAYLQPFFTIKSNSEKWPLLREYTPLWHTPAQASMNVGGGNLDC